MATCWGLLLFPPARICSFVAISHSGSSELPGLEVEIPGSGICTYYQARYQCACACCLTSLFSLISTGRYDCSTPLRLYLINFRRDIFQLPINSISSMNTIYALIEYDLPQQNNSQPPRPLPNPTTPRRAPNKEPAQDARTQHGGHR